MSSHRAVIEAGPSVVRRLCCGTGMVTETEGTAALSAIDDPVALVNGRPVAVESLWRPMLRSLSCEGSAGVIVVHPSWWPASRIGLISTAASVLADEPNDVVVHPRSWLLTQGPSDEAVVVEIADRLVAISGAEIVAVPRLAQPHPVAEQVAGVITDMAPAAAVLIDAPGAVAGAAALAASIADALRGSSRKVVRIDDARLSRLARLAGASVSSEPPAVSGVPSRARKLAGVGAAGVAVAALGLAAPTGTQVDHHDVAPAAKAPTTFLVEGRVALTVPADWAAERVVAGPGSARVQVTSPSDPEVALHVTQSSVAGETLARAAERLKQAIAAEPAGVFVDFNPSGSSAGRPAVTYREVRAGHHVRWTVLLDEAVRISVGCQSRPGGEDAVREVCDQAVRSAHAVG
ncbi:type VII secretion-associated protein [Mycobacterium sp.]|uniref:type VII secretion-associated protein n=1 Tax=Mycobacterium sp. TaxID=1785 RepID=UPI002C5905FF|nr:type VII secretion-associated protein [Mycobacterium sp.]HTQ19207.1 type VII secretion-associated protein [Mycobacterium sp.]